MNTAGDGSIGMLEEEYTLWFGVELESDNIAIQVTYTTLNATAIASGTRLDRGRQFRVSCAVTRCNHLITLIIPSLITPSLLVYTPTTPLATCLLVSPGAIALIVLSLLFTSRIISHLIHLPQLASPVQCRG